MSKKLDFIHYEQSRQKHPKKRQVGSRDQLQTNAAQHHERSDQQEPGTGKLSNDHSNTGYLSPNHIKKGRLTSGSRHDRNPMGAVPQNQISAQRRRRRRPHATHQQLSRAGTLRSVSIPTLPSSICLQQSSWIVRGSALEGT